MRKALYLATALAFGVSTAVMPVSPVRAQELATPMIPPKPTGAGARMPENVMAAWGCILTGTVGTTAAVVANSENLLNVVAGGVVAPANPAVLYIGLAAVVFTTFCSVGQQLTPLYLYYFHTDDGADVDMAKADERRTRAAQVGLANGDDIMFPWQSAE